MRDNGARLGRRSFIAVGASGLAALGALLAACGAGAPASPTAAPAGAAAPAAKSTEATTSAPKPAGKAGVEVNLIAHSWVIDEWKLKDWIAKYNGLGRDKVNLEQVPEGWDAKVLAMIRAGNVSWDGLGIMSTQSEKVKFIESGMVQPINSFITASSAEGAKDLVNDWVPTVKQDVSYKGKLYGIPYSFEAIGMMWYREPLAAVGYKELPTTWEETLDAAKKVGAQFKGEQITPISWIDRMHGSIQGLTMTATKTPYTDEGLVDFSGEAAIKALGWMQTLFKEGVTPPHGSDGYLEIWQRAKLSMLIAQNSRGVWAQRVHGAEKADTGMLPLPTKGAANSGAPFWSNTFAVFDKAKQPQAYTDFLIWLLGPANKDVHQAIVESGKCPVPRSIYPAMIDTKPQYKWMALHRDMVAASVPYPENSFWALQNTKVLPWITRLMEKDTKLTPEEAMAGAVKEIKEEVAKQKVR